MQAIKFNVGQTYSVRFMSDSDSVAHFTIVKRTAKTVTFARPNGTLTRRISEWCGVEQFRPFGSYSMCMLIDAKAPDLSQRGTI